MGFKKDIENYQAFSEEKFIYHSDPKASFWSEFSGFALRIIKMSGTPEIKDVLDAWACIIPCETSKNWGYDFLVQDLDDFISSIHGKVRNGKFNVLMDCLSALIGNDNDALEEVNEFLSDHYIGYRAEIDNWLGELFWVTVEENDIIDKLQESSVVVKTDSQQAYEEMIRAIESLKSSQDERARKDAVRSCASAMEALIKVYGNDNDIKEASKKIREEGIWGLDDIVKAGCSIFNNLHRLYPDLRHGSLQTSSMSLEEAEYWINEMQNYMIYMKKMAEKNGR